jgi:hypothetical protein
VAEQAAVEQDAWGEVRALLEELVVVAAVVLVGVVAVAVVGGEVGVRVGGMGVQGRLSCPQREGGGGVGAEHGGWKGIRGGPRRRAWCFRQPPESIGGGFEWDAAGSVCAVWESRGIVRDVAPWGPRVACTLQ